MGVDLAGLRIAAAANTGAAMIGGLWHPNSEPDDEDEAANRAMHWAGLIDQVMSNSSDDGDGAGFGFVCAAVEHFSQVVMTEDPNGPWVKYAVLFLSEDEALQ